MTINPSNVGPFDVTPSGAISVNQTVRIPISELTSPETGKRGYLRKYFGDNGGFDYVYVQNSSGEKVLVNTDGEEAIQVPPATSNNISGGAYTFVNITNIGGAEISDGDVNVSVGNGPRQNEQAAQFSARNLAKDLIPGLR